MAEQPNIMVFFWENFGWGSSAARDAGREVMIRLNGNRLQAVKSRQLKMYLFKQDDVYSTWVLYNSPHIDDVVWDQREEHQGDPIDLGRLGVRPASIGASAMRYLTPEPAILQLDLSGAVR
jgi:arylsulfatase